MSPGSKHKRKPEPIARSFPQNVQHGRGAGGQPANRFESSYSEPDFDHWEHEPEEREPGVIRTQFFEDSSRSIVVHNDSPDISFRYSMNPYRGCEHGCSYCYARPYHEYLGLSAGLDFETKIFVKYRAAELFREFLNRPGWQGETIHISGVTDCYQPAERKFELTRQCLQVALESRQPMAIITKNALVLRDLDILREMGAKNLIRVFVSVTTLDPELARVMEPRTSIPAARLRAVKDLNDAGVPTGVMVAPIIPALNDSEIPSILEAASQAGAVSAGFTILRLALTVKPIFLEWLERNLPSKHQAVVAAIQSVRGGKLTDSRFGTRMSGEGLRARQIEKTFEVFKRKFSLNREVPPLDSTHFCAPQVKHGQLRLF